MRKVGSWEIFDNNDGAGMGIGRKFGNFTNANLENQVFDVEAEWILEFRFIFMLI